MALVSVRTIVIYTMILTIFSLFTGAFFEGQDININQEDKHSLLSTTRGMIDALGQTENFYQKTALYIQLVFFVPLTLISAVFKFALFPFGALKYLPPLVSFIIYTPYTVIIFFDVLLPLLLKIIELIERGIEAIVPF